MLSHVTQNDGMFSKFRQYKYILRNLNTNWGVCLLTNFFWQSWESIISKILEF